MRERSRGRRKGGRKRGGGKGRKDECYILSEGLRVFELNNFCDFPPISCSKSICPLRVSKSAP